MFTALGPVESVFFRGVGPGGYDIYGAKFANGFAELRILTSWIALMAMRRPPRLRVGPAIRNGSVLTSANISQLREALGEYAADGHRREK